MTNWFTDKTVTIAKICNAACAEMEPMVAGECDSGNYWIDNRHNIFCVICETMGERWYEVHYELYDSDEELIGDITVADTVSDTMESLRNEIEVIVKMYFGE